MVIISTDVFLVKAEQIVILTIKEEEYLVWYFQLNTVDNFAPVGSYIEQYFFLQK